MVYADHMHVRILVWNTLSNLYGLDRGITAERVSLCVVLVIVSLNCSRHIYHRLLSSSGDTVD